jgi:hypothetical protein
MKGRLLAAGSIVLIIFVFYGLSTLGTKIAPMFSSTAASLNGGGSYAVTRPEAASSGGAPGARAPGAPAESPPAASDQGRQAANAGQVAAQVLPSLDRMIIRTVTLSLLVPDVAEAYRQVERIAAEQGGLIGASQVRQEGDLATATVTVRVPADHATYAATMERLRALAEKVVDEQVQTQDASEEYVDLESRLRSLRLTEERLLALYDRAQRLEEIFAVQRELTTVRGQIEQAQGRKQAIERRSAMATINLQLRATAAAPRTQVEWSPLRVAGDAAAALAVVLRSVGTVVIWLAIWLPLYGIPLLALWLFRRRLGAALRTLTH